MEQASSRPAAILGFPAAIVAGAAGAALFYVVNLPLPFILGPMFVCLIFNLIWPVLSCPKWVRPPVVALIGVMLGTAFSPQLLQSLGQWIAPFFGLLGVVAATMVTNFIYYRFVAGFDRATAFFSSAPGGLTEMIILGGQSGAKETDIALAHSSRILIVVMLLPWAIRYLLGVPFDGRTVAGPTIAEGPVLSLALIAICGVGGAALGKRLKFPAFAFVGPMVVSALIHLGGASDFSVPRELVIVAQLLLGVSVGVGFVGVRAVLVLRAIFHGLFASLTMICIGLAGAWGASRMTAFDTSVLLLAFAPGGFPEMSLIAYAMGADVALVATFHVLRLSIVLLAVPLVFRTVISRPSAGPDRR